MLATISMPDGSPLTIVPPEQLDGLAQQGLQSIEGVVVTPEECGAVFEAAAQMPEGTRYAVGAAVNPTDQSATIITLTELDGAEIPAGGCSSTRRNLLHVSGRTAG